MQRRAGSKPDSHAARRPRAAAGPIYGQIADDVHRDAVGRRLAHQGSMAASFVVVTTCDLPEAYFLASFLESRGQELALVSLVRRPLTQTARVFARLARRRGLRYLADLLLGRALRDRYLAGPSPFPEIDAGVIARLRRTWPHLDCVDPHSDAALRFVEQRAPDYMLLAGAPILKSRFFGLARGGALNRHLGVLPHHRGSDCPIWLLALDQPEAVGYSIHFVADRVDGGDIVTSSPLPVTPGETVGRYLARLQRTASLAFIDVIDRLIDGRPVSRTPQGALGIQFPPAPLSTLRRAARNTGRFAPAAGCHAGAGSR